MKHLKGRNVLVFGVGRTGLAVSRFLIQRGAEVIVTDSNMEKLEDCRDSLEGMGVTVDSGGNDTDTFLSVDMIVLSPGVNPCLPPVLLARKKGIDVTGEIELASGFIQTPIIAITGTNGKSTVTSLLGDVLKDAGKKVFVGGNIGTPLIEYLLDDQNKSTDFVVLEVSSFQLETVKKFRPKVAVLLNLSFDHMDRYDSMDNYLRTKCNIFKNQGKGDIAVLNMDDRRVSAVRSRIGEDVDKILFSTEKAVKGGIFLRGDEVTSTICGSEEACSTADLDLNGRHDIQNLMAVIAVSLNLGVNMGDVINSFRNFNGLPHRIEFVREINNVRYYDDSKSTNIDALNSALRGMEEGIILIAGGRDKGGDYTLLADEIRKKVKLLLLIGEAGKKIRDILGGIVDTEIKETLDEAVSTAFMRSRPDDIVLFSPSCSSFDMFRNFEDRGDQFKCLVNQIYVENKRYR